MIFKIIVFGVVAYLVYAFFFKKNREKNVKDNNGEYLEDTMVECPSCGTYISKDEAVLSNGKYFCSQKCLTHK